MKYVTREDNKIVAVYTHPNKEAQEAIADDDQELVGFYTPKPSQDPINDILARIEALEAKVGRS